jgi:hypothetical protein
MTRLTYLVGLTNILKKRPYCFIAPDLARVHLPVWQHNFCKEITKKSMLLKGVGINGSRMHFQ